MAPTLSGSPIGQPWGETVHPSAFFHMQGLCTRSNEQGSFAVKIQNTQLKKKKMGGSLMVG